MIDWLLTVALAERIAILVSASMLGGVFGGWIGWFRNRMGLGMLLGMLLGPIGWLLLLLIRPAYVPCPECNAAAHPKWARCPVCKCDLQRALKHSLGSQQRAAHAKWR